MDWPGAFGVEAPKGERSVIIILPRAERDYETEKTYKSERAAVFANYRGDAPMHEVIPQMVEQLWDGWRQSKALSSEMHCENVTNTL